MVGPNQHAQILDAYKQMWETGLYRPAAPSDLMGHTNLTEEQFRDPHRLEEEAARYAGKFIEEERDNRFNVGCAGWEANQALVYLIEAARAVCARDFEFATTLLKMAAAEVEWASQQEL